MICSARCRMICKNGISRYSYYSLAKDLTGGVYLTHQEDGGRMKGGCYGDEHRTDHRCVERSRVYVM